MIVISKEDLIRKKSQMNEVQNFANFHTCYLPYGFEFVHKGHPKHKLNYSWPNDKSFSLGPSYLLTP